MIKKIVKTVCVTLFGIILVIGMVWEGAVLAKPLVVSAEPLSIFFGVLLFLAALAMAVITLLTLIGCATKQTLQGESESIL